MQKSVYTSTGHVKKYLHSSLQLVLYWLYVVPQTLLAHLMLIIWNFWKCNIFQDENCNKTAVDKPCNSMSSWLLTGIWKFRHISLRYMKCYQRSYFRKVNVSDITSHFFLDLNCECKRACWNSWCSLSLSENYQEPWEKTSICYNTHCFLSLKDTQTVLSLAGNLCAEM